MHLLLAADEAGGHAGVMELNWLPAVTSLVVFLLAFGFLYVKVWPKILKGLDDRQAKILGEIESAEQAREQAQAAQAQYQEELANARQEAKDVIATAKAHAKAAAQELRDRNEAQLAQMRQRVTRELDQAKQAAIIALHAEAASLASNIAGKILKREITADDQQRLVDESLQELTGAREGS